MAGPAQGSPLDLRGHTLYPVCQSGELIRAYRPPGLQSGPAVVYVPGDISQTVTLLGIQRPCLPLVGDDARLAR